MLYKYSVAKRLHRKNWLSEEFRSRHVKALEDVFIQLKTDKPYDLRGLSVGVEGPLRTLWNAHLHTAKISNVDLSHSIFSCSFRDSRFINVKFDNAFFDVGRIINAKFEKCSFVNAKMIVNLNDSAFDLCDFSAAQFRRRAGFLNLREYGGRRVAFTNCNFSGARFHGVEIRASHFINCNFDGCLFKKCDLRGVKFEENTPTISQFKGSDLRGATINGQAIVTG